MVTTAPLWVPAPHGTRQPVPSAAEALACCTGEPANPAHVAAGLRYPPGMLHTPAGTVLCLLLGGLARAQPSLSAELPSGASGTTVDVREPLKTLRVHREPNPRSPVRGRLIKGEPVVVHARVDGPGCPTAAGWGQLQGGGYVCLEKTQPSTKQPTALPRLTTFDHPETDEYFDYLETGSYDRQDLAGGEELVPFVYGKVWQRWRAPYWASVEAWEAHRPSAGDLGLVRKYHFDAVIETARGTVLRRPDGKIVPLSGVFLYPMSRFHGRDLAARPLAPGTLPAWVHGYDGAPVYSSPNARGKPAVVLPYHQELAVVAQPVDSTGHWWEIPDALGPGIPGYAHDQVGIRHWVTRSAPADVAEDELWVDVDAEQQVLAVRRGEDLVFATLVSTGKEGEHDTPSGLFRVSMKNVHTDMFSGPNAESPYHVERVPWVARFFGQYYLHGAFWHWGFGHSTSHGCINLSPRDARFVFDALSPVLPIGWAAVYETPQELGTVVRIRRGSDSRVRDFRRPLGSTRQASR